MSEANPTPEWKYGDDPPSQYITKDDLDRALAQVARPRMDLSQVTTDSDREVAAILEVMEKDPVKGFQQHNQYIVNQVSKQVGQILEQHMGKMREDQQVDGVRLQIAQRIAVGLDDGAQTYIRDYLKDYDMAGLSNLIKHKPTLDTLRLAAENVSSKKGGGGGTPAVGSGGTGGGSAGGGNGLSTELEAEAQEMFGRLKNVKGFTIEKARAAVAGVEGDPSNFSQKTPQAWGS